MKILGISDIHSLPIGRKLIDAAIDANSPDLLVITGDITHFGPASVAETILSNLKVRCAAVPGNCDPDEVLKVIEQRCISLNGKRVEIDGIPFVGLGGAPCCNFNTPREISEEEYDSLLSSTMVERCVLVSHTPASGILDLTPSGKSLGSKVIADYVGRFTPRLVLSGHVHEARGTVVKGDTVFANPGPLKEGHAVIAEVTGSGAKAKIITL
jgi:hypothetical protein